MSFGSFIRPLLGLRRGDGDEGGEHAPPPESGAPPSPAGRTDSEGTLAGESTAVAPSDGYPPPWSCFAASAQGARHGRSGQPNQDAVGIGVMRDDAVHVSLVDGKDVLRTPCRTPFFVAVSDGHGSTRHFRSDCGARFAIEAALEVLADAIREEGEQRDPTRIEHLLRNQAGVLLKTWRQKVRAHIDTNPFDSVQREFLDRQVEERTGQAHGRRRPEEVVRAEQEMAAYGATLLAAVLTEAYTAYVQIGDGDIATVQADGLVERPVPDDEALLGTSTTSLCTAAAEQDFRVRVVPHGSSPPALVTLCTDGYEQSFADEASFLRSAYDYFELLRNDEGREGIAEHLHEWMSEITLEGSGDDTTIALVAHSSTVTSHEEPAFRIAEDKRPSTTKSKGKPSGHPGDDPHAVAHQPAEDGFRLAGGSSEGEGASPATSAERTP